MRRGGRKTLVRLLTLLHRIAKGSENERHFPEMVVDGPDEGDEETDEGVCCC